MSETEKFFENIFGWLNNEGPAFLEGMARGLGVAFVTALILTGLILWIMWRWVDRKVDGK